MPNIKSAKKRVKIIKTKALQNQIVKTSLKTVIKKFDAVVAKDAKDDASAAFTLAVKKIDQAVAKGVIKKNTASRKKSQLAKKLNLLNV